MMRATLHRARILSARHIAGEHVTARFTARFGVAAALVVAASYVAQVSLYVNFTRSLPIGPYRRIGGAPARGDLVVACMPRHAGEFARRRGYVWRGDCPGAAAPVGKRILAIAGDTVAVIPEGLRLNGRAVPNSRLVARDSRGRAITHFPFGAHILRPGQIWLFSSFHPMSFDSRYFGPVQSSRIRARIWPLWTVQPTSPGGDATVLSHIAKPGRDAGLRTCRTPPFGRQRNAASTTGALAKYAPTVSSTAECRTFAFMERAARLVMCPLISKRWSASTSISTPTGTLMM